ncbi:hypothetical protein E3N88_40924 [Mikania micrantha]|uniref:Uncharacterized protein n=1 Tax=Mikania micrantha TaxID=192012 RepID=A0A5N6LP32_9ASTR|nr:hypothetical protein E3N88_40924 [Mikania micrantha]
MASTERPYVTIAGLKCARNWEHGRKPCVKPSYGLSGIAKRRKILKLDPSRYATTPWSLVAVRDKSRYQILSGIPRGNQYQR